MEPKPEEKLPVYPKKLAPRVDASVAKRINALKTWRDSKARALDIDPGIFFSNSLISVIAVQHPLCATTLDKIPEMKHWQRREFGREIMAILKK